MADIELVIKMPESIWVAISLSQKERKKNEK